MRILFTDGIGAAVLHSGKPAPANRASNWVTKSLPAGDSVNRDSDDRLFMFALHDNFGCTFDLTQIPVLPTNTNLIEVLGDITGTTGATPTGMTPVAPNTAVAQVRSNGFPGDIGYNGILAVHTTGASGTGLNVGGIVFSSPVSGHTYTAGIWVYIPSGSTATDVFVSTENITVTGHADLTKLNQWQFVQSTGSCTGGGFQTCALKVTAPGAGAVVYSDLWAITDVTAPAFMHMVDVADRLMYWLANGGTCEVDTGDVDGLGYATCSLAPGTTPSLVLSDKRNLEYTLSLALINVAVSPVRMVCHYA